jgi:hypothetical protein
MFQADLSDIFVQPPNPSFWRELTSTQSKEHDVVHHNDVALAGRRGPSKDGRVPSLDRHGTNSESRYRNARDAQALRVGKRAASSTTRVKNGGGHS